MQWSEMPQERIRFECLCCLYEDCMMLVIKENQGCFGLEVLLICISGDPEFCEGGTRTKNFGFSLNYCCPTPNLLRSGGDRKDAVQCERSFVLLNSLILVSKEVPDNKRFQL